MLQKKAFAGKPLAAKPVQVRSMDLAADPAVAARIARLGVLRRCQSLYEALHLRGSPAPLFGGACTFLDWPAKRTPRTSAVPARYAAGWRRCDHTIDVKCRLHARRD